MGEENEIFSCLVGVKREREGKWGWVEISHQRTWIVGVVLIDKLF